jgi:hypothetical protein
VLTFSAKPTQPRLSSSGSGGNELVRHKHHRRTLAIELNLVNDGQFIMGICVQMMSHFAVAVSQ